MYLAVATVAFDRRRALCPSGYGADRNGRGFQMTFNDRVGATTLPDTAVVRARSRAPHDRPRGVSRRRACVDRYELSSEESERGRRVSAVVQKAWRRIEHLRSAGKCRLAKRKARTLMGSKSLSYWAALKILKDSYPNERVGLSVETLAERARDFSISDDARIQLLAKSNGGHRAIVAFTLTDRVRQLVLQKSLGLLVEHHPNQTGVQGKGTTHAVEMVRRFIRSGKFTFGLEIDISDFFGSIDCAWVARHYGISRRVAREVLSIEGKLERRQIHTRDRHSEQYIDTHISRMPNLPQGASSSPIFAYGLLQSLMVDFERCHPEVALVSNCDNFLLMAPSRQVMESARTTLIRMLAEHPAGTFMARATSPIRRLADGIEYLGSRFSSRKGQPIVQARKERLQAFRRRFSLLVKEIDRPTIRGLTMDGRLEEAVQYARHNLPQFKLATEDYFDLLSEVDCCMQRFGSHYFAKQFISYARSRLPEEDDSRNNSIDGHMSNQWKRQIAEWGRRFDLDYLTLNRAIAFRNNVAKPCTCDTRIFPRARHRVQG